MFKYDLDQKVDIVGSHEHGKVIARVEYVSSDPSYLVRYLAADGRMVESWWDENALYLSN